MQTKARSKADR